MLVAGWVCDFDSVASVSLGMVEGGVDPFEKRLGAVARDDFRDAKTGG